MRVEHNSHLPRLLAENADRQAEEAQLGHCVHSAVAEDGSGGAEPGGGGRRLGAVGGGAERAKGGAGPEGRGRGGLDLVVEPVPGGAWHRLLVSDMRQC